MRSAPVRIAGTALRAGFVRCAILSMAQDTASVPQKREMSNGVGTITSVAVVLIDDVNDLMRFVSLPLAQPHEQSPASFSPHDQECGFAGGLLHGQGGRHVYEAEVICRATAAAFTHDAQPSGSRCQAEVAPAIRDGRGALNLKLVRAAAPPRPRPGDVLDCDGRAFGSRKALSARLMS